MFFPHPAPFETQTIEGLRRSCEVLSPLLSTQSYHASMSACALALLQSNTLAAKRHFFQAIAITKVEKRGQNWRINACFAEVCLPKARAESSVLSGPSWGGLRGSPGQTFSCNSALGRPRGQRLWLRNLGTLHMDMGVQTLQGSRY